MILKSYEINKIKSDTDQTILLYGQNHGAKEEAIAKILEDNKNRSISKYEEKEFIENLETVYESIISKSLFEDKKIIIIHRASDKIVNSINYLQEKNINDVLIIIEANNLEKKSKLRSLFEKDKKNICIAFYPDTQETLSKLALNFFNTHNIKISRSNLNLIINKCNGDRGVLRNELNKIQQFIKNKKILKEEDLLKLTNLIENYSIGELVDNSLAQNKNKTLLILNENIFSTEDCIIITRTFLQKAKRLLKLDEDYQKNNSLEETLSKARPPIFWKDKEIVKQQLKNWKQNSLNKLLVELNEIELLTKKNRSDPVNLLRNFIIEMISTKTNN